MKNKGKKSLATLLKGKETNARDNFQTEAQSTISAPQFVLATRKFRTKNEAPYHINRKRFIS